METITPTHSAISQSTVSSAQSEATFLATRLIWWRLYSEPDCWMNPQKRQAMLSARLQYQDAKLDWLFRSRSFDDLQKLYADVLASVKNGFLGLTVADVADAHRKMKAGSSANGLVGWAIAQHLRECLDA